MKRHIPVFAFLLSAFAAVGLSAFAAGSGSDNMRLSPIGYRLGETGAVTAYDPSVVTVEPSDTSNVVSNKPVTLTAVLNRDYKVIRWQKFNDDPTRRTELDPIEEFGEKSETVSVDFNPKVTWMYVTVVVKYDPVRTVKVGRSSFGKGTVTVSPEKTSYQKGDEVTLTAEPAEGYSFVRWSDGNPDHTRTLTVDDDIDLTAYIEPDSSRVSFSAGAGAVLDVTSKRVSFGNVYGELPLPTRTGAKFSGWTDDEKRTVTAKTEVNRTADHTLYASWSDLLYEITWDFTGCGNGKVEGTGTYAYGSQPTLKAVPYEGSAFTGWTDGVTLNPRRITVLSNALYVAAFDVATYDVTFTYRDVSGNPVTTGPTNVAYGTAAIAPEVPEWPEHTFANWSTEEYKKVTRDLAVEAIYDTMTYSVAFAYRDWQGNSVTTMPQHVVSGGKANPPDRSVVDNWTGNTFKGWAPDYNVIRQDTLCEAIYETNTYTVTFSYCDAKGEELKHIEYVRHGEKVPFDYAESVKNLWSGHRFVYWSYGGRAIEDIDNVLATCNMQISAAYEGYARITYAANGGEGEMPMQVYTNYVGEVQLASNAFTKTGYLFNGWSTDGSDNPVYGDGDTVAVSDGIALALTACWTPITYTVTYHKNDGTEVRYADPKLFYYDQPDLLISHSDFGKHIGWPTGYDFKGLSIDTEWDGKTPLYNLSDEVTNLTAEANAVVDLYAIWQGKPQVVTINGVTTNIAYGSQLQQPPDPVRTGYTFDGGWTTNGVSVTFPITVTGSFELKSEDKWTTNKYTVVFHGTDADGGTMEPQAFIYDVEQALTANAFMRTGYTFVNWTNEVGKIFADGAWVKNLATNDGAVVDLYATWTMNPRYYAVRFNPNGGLGAPYVQDIECGVETALMTNRFARTGYGFANWTNATGTVYADGEKVTDLAAEGETNDLYAVWTPNSYWVKFEGNAADGGGKMENQAFTYDVAQALTSNAFTKTGYSFDGWKTNETGEAVFVDGAVVSNLTTEADATNTLWATWTPNKYTVVIDGVSTEMDYGSDIAKPADPAAREGYTFTGWTTNGASVAAWPLKVPLGGLTISSEWTANAYTVEFRGPGEAYTQDFTYDESQALTANRFTAPELMVFDCWTNAVDSTTYADRETVCNLATGGVFALYATWKEAPSYSVAFDGNGADGGSMANLRFECGKGGTLPANGFTRTGYTFGQWTNRVNGATYADGATFAEDLAPTNGTATLSALWTANRYWVAFDGNGADGGEAMAEQAFAYDEAQALTANAFTRTGYGFAGWVTNLTDSAVFGDGEVVSNLTAEADATNTLWATWTVKSYEISFNSAGGSAVGPVTNEFGKTTSAPAEPTRTGYQFAGWYRGEVKYEFGQPMPAENFVLTAHWTANAYTVKFDPGEGSGTMADQAFTYDEPKNLTPNEFTAPELMVFDCWTNAVDSTTYADRETVCNLATGGVFALYATWKDAPSYTVAFDGNGGEGEMANLRFECGAGGTLPANGFTRTGYTFDQWTNKVNGATYADGATFAEDLAPTNGTATLSALWTANRYWVKFDGNEADGGEAMAEQAFAYDEAQALTANAFTRTGYGFAGWATNLTATGMSPPPLANGAVVSNLTAEADATNTLWATWTANQYTVVYHGPDGKTSDQLFTYDKEQKLKGADTFDPPETWMVFVGWTNAVGNAYAADLAVSNLTAEAGGTVNLYAAWGDDSYTVTFDGNDATGGEMEPQIFKHGETKALDPNEYRRIGHTFVKWTDAGGKAYADKAAFKAQETGIGETLHAVWKAIPYTDSFDGLTETFDYGARVTRDPPSSKPGYTFNGWTTNGIDVIDLDPATSTFVQPDHAVAFTSKWEAITYTIAFDGNGATTVAMASTNVKYDVAIALPSNTYVLARHEFKGWATSNDASDPIYTNGQICTPNLTTEAGKTVTLYAVWKESADPLCMALGLPSNWTATNLGNAWTVIGASVDGNGLQRTSADESAYLELNVPGPGSLYFEFDVGKSMYGELDVDFNGERIDDDSERPAEYSQSATPTLQIGKAGTLRFSGAPDNGGPWTLKNFKWTAK